MKIKHNSEIISGAVFLIVAAVLWLLIPSQIDTMETSSINAQTVPRIVVGGMFLFSVGLFLQGIFIMPKKETIINKACFSSQKFKLEMKSVLYSTFLIVYLFLITWIGFLVSTALLVIAILLYYGANKWYYYLISLSTVGIVYYIFKMLLHVSLP